MSKVNATQLATIATLAQKGAQSLAATFDAGMKFEEFKAQTTADALALRQYALDEKIGFDVLFKGNKKTNVIRAKIADAMAQFEATKGESTVRRYVTAFIDVVQTGEVFNPSKGNGADKPKADKPKADAPKADAPKADAPKADAGQTAHSEQNAPANAPAPSAGTVVTKENVADIQSQDGNNGPDVQQKPDATPHDLAVQYLETARLNINQAFLLLGKIHYKSGQATCQDIAQQIADMIAFVNEAKK